jgi:hypothetical protein
VFLKLARGQQLRAAITITLTDSNKRSFEQFISRSSVPVFIAFVGTEQGKSNKSASIQDNIIWHCSSKEKDDYTTNSNG